MTLLIIGLSLSFIAIGFLFYFNRQLKRTIKLNNTALLVLQKEFTQYQVTEKRIQEKETAKREIRFDNVARSIKKNEDAIYGVNLRMPDEIKKCIKHIELARPLDRK
tara:strand:+ start:353 stop:673 length:321 start_codon:yes stop_codon:yes gene_type:complete